LEISIHKKILHDNIIRLLEIFEEKNCIFIVQEYGSSNLILEGDLLNLIKYKKLSDSYIQKYFVDILNAIAYLHSCSIVHRDIKLDNIIINYQNKAKLSDFGMCKLSGKGDLITEQDGTASYLAPEIVFSSEYNGFMSDIWSLGVVLYVMTTNNFPYKSDDINQLKNSIQNKNIEIPNYLASELQELLIKMLEIDSKKRITIPEIFANKWVNPSFEENKKKGIISYHDCFNKAKIIKNKNINIINPFNLFTNKDQFMTLIDYMRITKRSNEQELSQLYIQQLASFGYNKGKVIYSIQLNEINHITCSYYLLRLKEEKKYYEENNKI